MKQTVGVAIPSIPVRAPLLGRALKSVVEQTYPVTQISITVDHEKRGAAYTRQDALMGLDTEWVAFLDDDDEFLPHHVEKLLDFAVENEADYVFPWFTVVGGGDPFPQHFGLPWDNDVPRQTTVTTLVRTSLAQDIGFLRPNEGDVVGGQVWGEDYQFTLECLNAGAKIMHLSERTWLWHHDSQNTSGRPDRW